MDVIPDLERQVRYEAFLADCAAQFSAVLLPGDLEHQIERALHGLLAFFGAERCALLGGAPGHRLSWTTCAAHDGVSDSPFAFDFAAAFPWHFDRLCGTDEALAVVTLADLPAEAERDRESAEKMGIRSMLTVPARGDDGDSHCLLMQSLRRECSWPQAYVARLPMLTRVFANALRRQLAQQQAQVESRHADVLESVGAILWRADARTLQTTFVSREAESLLGYPLESWVRVPGFWLDHIHPDDREWVEGFTTKAIRELRKHDFEYRMVVADGRTVWLRNIVKVIVDRGEAAALVGVTVDVTERKRAEFEAAQLRDQLTHAGRVTSLGELAATLAHELNQPLGAMVSNAESARVFLDRIPPDLDHLRAILDDIARDGQRAGDIVHRVRMLLQKQAFEMQPVDAAALVVAVVALARPLAQSRQIDLRVDVEPRLPSRGDAVQLQQVLLNLLLNAIEAVAEQPPDARRIVVRGMHRGAHVEISVDDTGRGIPDAALSRVFDPFFTTRTGGMGMGLAISRTIVEAHGGHIAVANNPGGGVTVGITLPAGNPSEQSVS